MGKSREVARLPNAPAFSAYRATNQSLTTATLTKVICDTEEFDTAGAYDATTNYRFQPTVPGYYQINGQCQFAGVTLTLGLVAIYKNGSLFKRGGDVRVSMDQFLGANVSALVYMNGSTDYLELWCYALGTTLRLEAASSDNYIQGVLVRPA